MVRQLRPIIGLEWPVGRGRQQVLSRPLEVQLSQQGRVQQGGLLLLVQMRLVGHVGLLLNGHRSRDRQQSVEQGVGRVAVVDLFAEGLDEPGAGVAAPEGEVVPEGSLEDEEVCKVWYFVGRG